MQSISKLLLLISAICVVTVFSCKGSQSGSNAVQNSRDKPSPVLIVPLNQGLPSPKKHYRKKRYADDDDDDKAEEIRDRVTKRFG
ncbi:unnamed protein product [Nezara viridula]|uniref:Neuropeptide n=1 Tax=Nezara viridula TaxID=85310 RepID=A0A9P0HIH8_NEZVI|nr:unnamed protein product [Nezara viridula]